MKLYSLDDGPPSISVRMVLKALNLEWENVAVDYNSGEHLGDEYAKVRTRNRIECVLYLGITKSKSSIK